MVTPLFGICVLILPCAVNLLAGTGDDDQVTGAFATTLSHGGIAMLERQYAVIRGFGLQFVEPAAPGDGRRSGLPEPRFDRFPASDLPAVAEAETSS